MTQGPLGVPESPSGDCETLSFPTNTSGCTKLSPMYFNPNNRSQQIVCRSSYENPSVIVNQELRRLAKIQNSNILHYWGVKIDLKKMFMLLIIYNDFIIVFNKSVNVLSFSVLIPKMVKKKKNKPKTK